MTRHSDYRVSYLTKDGIRLAGVLSMPSKIHNNPAIIMAHGFCADKDENGFFIKAADKFANNGYAVLRFDFRGCGESEGKFEEVRLADNIRDLEATVNFLKTSEYEINKNGFAFVGFSLGATIEIISNIKEFVVSAFWAPAFFPQDDMFPRYYNDMVLLEISINGYHSKSDKKVSRDFIEDLGFCSTENKLKNYTKPSLVIHGLKDNKINPNSSEKAYRFITAHKSKKFIGGASHSFKESDEFRKQVIEMTLEWFKYYLPIKNNSVSMKDSLGKGKYSRERVVGSSIKKLTLSRTKQPRRSKTFLAANTEGDIEENGQLLFTWNLGKKR